MACVTNRTVSFVRLQISTSSSCKRSWVMASSAPYAPAVDIVFARPSIEQPGELGLVPKYRFHGKDLHPGPSLGTTLIAARYSNGAINFGKENPEEANAPSAPSVTQLTGGVLLWRPRAMPHRGVVPGNRFLARAVKPLTGWHAQSLEVLSWMHELKSVGRPRTRRNSRNATGNRRLDPRAALKPSKLNHLPANSRGGNGCASIGFRQAWRHACC
jgi:hypothetical protein